MNSAGKLAIIGLLAAGGVGFYFTPYWAVRAMRNAAEARDAAALSEYVDFPAVRESLKATLANKVAGAAHTENANPLLQLGVAMAGAFAGALGSPMIDALVTPESIALLFKGIRPDPTGTGPDPLGTDAVETSMYYESRDAFVVQVKRKGASGDPIGLVLQRSGIASWKLSAVRLP